MSNKHANANVPAEQPKASLPAVYDYSEYAGQGFESHTKDDYAVPFLGVLQALSPQIETIAEARPGMILNTVTNDIFDGKKGVGFIPVETKHEFVEWKAKRGGFVGTHQLDSALVKKVRDEQEFGKYKVDPSNPDSNELIETFYVYGILVTADSTEQAIIAFSSTKNKVYKRWMSKARTIQVTLPDGRRIPAPLFAHRYRLTTLKEKNSSGQEYYNFDVSFDGTDATACRLGTDDPLFKQAVEFRNLVKEGSVKAAHETAVNTDSASTSDADIPFA